jgi:transposase
MGPEEKLRIVRETLLPGTVIADVARRHGIGTGLLYTWRKAMLASAVSGFARVEVQPAPEVEDRSPAKAKPLVSGRKPPSGRIEIEFPTGVRVRVDGGVDDTVLRGVLAALDDR